MSQRILDMTLLEVPMNDTPWSVDVAELIVPDNIVVLEGSGRIFIESDGVELHVWVTDVGVQLDCIVLPQTNIQPVSTF